MPANVASVLSIIKLILLFLIMAVAVYMDVRKRTIPNILPLAIAGVSFIPPLWPHFDGIVVGLILIIVAVLVGGIGGGDIKMITAVGLCLGFSQTAMAGIQNCRVDASSACQLSSANRLRTCSLSVPRFYPRLLCRML